jgi:hypothetical protein
MTSKGENHAQNNSLLDVFEFGRKLVIVGNHPYRTAQWLYNGRRHKSPTRQGTSIFHKHPWQRMVL